MTNTTPEAGRLTAGAVGRDTETGLPFDSGADTAVERWFRTHFNAATALGFPMAGYVAERDTRRRLQDRLANREAERELGRLRQEIVDAHGEATAEAVRADAAEAELARLRQATADARVANSPEPAGHFAKCTRCATPVFVHNDGSADGGVDTLLGILCDRCLNQPETETEDES